MDLNYTAEWKRAVRRQFLQALQRYAPAALEELRAVEGANAVTRRKAAAAWAQSCRLAAGGEPAWLLDAVEVALESGRSLADCAGPPDRGQGRPPHHFHWLVQSQVLGWPYSRIAANGNGRPGFSRDAVRNRVQELRAALELPPIRAAKRRKSRSMHRDNRFGFKRLGV